MNIQLTNTLLRKKEPFTKALQQPVSLYVCGITPYDHAHIGHGRVYVTFDLLVRILTFFGHEVIFVRNITDIDDKLINKAAADGDPSGFKTVADHYYGLFAQAMLMLGCQSPTHEPRVTECVDEIITFIQKLIEKGHAYVSGNDVYFDITSVPTYGKLSGRDSDALKAGARVDINEQKKNPGDFALWKGDNEFVFWKSPWGKGRPGWHIECSVMAEKHLGPSLDIHGGGMDLIFPHHENEIALSEAVHGVTFAKVWLHNAFVNINKEKMSKSLGNMIALKDLLAKKDAMIVRFFYLQHHYRSPIDFGYDDLDAAEVAYKKLVTHLGAYAGGGITLAQACSDSRLAAMVAALADDLNTPKFWGMVFEQLGAAKTDPELGKGMAALIKTVLGLTLAPLPEQAIIITPEMQTLLDQREQARKDKNWALADQLRDQLIALGYKIQDRKA